MNWLLIVVLAILAGNALVGLKVGFIKTVFSLISMIIAIVLTIWISPTVKDFMNNNDKFHTYISEKVEKIVKPEVEKNKNEQKDTIIDKLPLPKSIREGISNNDKVKASESASTKKLTSYIVEYLVGTIINALAFIVTFAVTLIILWLICFALNLISKLPGINSVNKTAGLLAGLVHGLVIVWIFFILLTVFGGTDFGKDTLQMIGESKTLSFIYNNNLLLRFVIGATRWFF
jgi:uncharacterized membrane protein required for colicin V production